MNETFFLANSPVTANDSLPAQGSEDSKTTKVESLAVEMICPTCRASQLWSDECYRCKSDLSELSAIHRASTRLRQKCLVAIQKSDFESAIEIAKECFDLDASPSTGQILAISQLLHQDLHAALKTYLLQKTENRV